MKVFSDYNGKYYLRPADINDDPIGTFDITQGEWDLYQQFLVEETKWQEYIQGLERTRVVMCVVCERYYQNATPDKDYLCKGCLQFANKLNKKLSQPSSL